MSKSHLFKLAILLLAPVLLLTCNTKRGSYISVSSNNAELDTVIITNVVTNQVLAKISTKYLKKIDLKLVDPVYASLKSSNSANSYLSILTPEMDKVIIIDSTLIKTNSVADSLEKYFTASINALFSKYGNLIFSGKESKKVTNLFDSLIQARKVTIEDSRGGVSQTEYEILNYHNQAKTFSFLFFYGRIIRKFSADNSFFDFINNIDISNNYIKTLPNNLLYKFEIEYLKSNDSIRNIESFTSFIDKSCQNIDLSNYLKIIYLRELLESPDYWVKHQQMFIADDIKKAVAAETNNQYKYILDKTLQNYFSTRKGEVAFDFEAKKLDGSILKLSYFKGKLVVIDAWATWCAPCLEHRPAYLELAKKYKNNANIKFLMISVDKNIEKWRSYTLKTNKENHGTELVMENGMTTFRDKYFITGIPTYILIDAKGYIINSDLPDPSVEMEVIIEEALNKIG